MSSLPAPDGFVVAPGWVPDADALLAECLRLPWEQREITLYGRTHPVPRLTCWLGEGTYRYSGIVNEPHPWPAELRALRDRLEQHTGARYTSCLANLYRDGDGTMGWHSDDEPELGPEPVIASVSLGAARDLRLRHRATRETRTLALHHGDLLMMSGRSQADWQHAVPRRARVRDPRVNLTFRELLT